MRKQITQLDVVYRRCRAVDCQRSFWESAVHPRVFCRYACQRRHAYRKKKMVAARDDRSQLE